MSNWRENEQGQRVKDIACPTCGEYYEMTYTQSVTAQPMTCPFCKADYDQAAEAKARNNYIGRPSNH